MSTDLPLACSGAWESLGCVCSLANAQCSFTGKCFNWKFPRLNWAQKVNANVPYQKSSVAMTTCSTSGSQSWVMGAGTAATVL